MAFPLSTGFLAVLSILIGVFVISICAVGTAARDAVVASATRASLLATRFLAGRTA